jgi:4-hydroxy-3-methylbut-2-enyl diphosphate reductase
VTAPAATADPAQPAVVTALRVERAALAGRLPGLPALTIGMGPARAGRLPGGRRGLLLVGVAGGLAPGVAPGDLVVASEVITETGRIPIPSAPLLAGALRRRGLRVHVGPLVASGSVVRGKRREELAATGALAVDMESGAVAGVAAGGPFAVVRAVVDTPDHPLLRPGTVVRGVTALRALRAAAPVLQEWAAAVDRRDVVLAAPRSFCAGVDRAIDIVERALDRFGAPVHVRRQIVHNAHVVQNLQDRGAVFVDEVDEVPEGGRVVLAAHGVAPAVRAQAEERGLSVIDATCPLVAKVHSEVRRYAGRGDTVFLVGHREHEEVEGTLGEAPGSVLVVEDAAAAATVEPVDPARVAYVMQTTLAVDEAQEVADALRGRFPLLAAPRTDDICYATSNRQAAVRAIAAACDLVLVVGSANSSNSRRLVEVAEREGTPAHLVDDAGDVDLAWLAGARRIGVTAGASAPPHLVDDLVRCLRGLGPVDVREERVTDEDVHFTLPKEVS